MTKESYAGNRKKRFLFYGLMILCAFIVVILQFFGPGKYSERISKSQILYQGDFVWQKSDGSSEAIQVPGKYKVPARETMTIVTQLPDDYTESTLVIRSSLQSIVFYVGGELRAGYDTSHTRLVGKNSASSYVFCPTSAADAGKEVRIELRTNTDKYSGVVNEVYCGDKAQIWEYLFHTYGLETIIGFFLLFAGIITIAFSIALGIAYQTKFDMEYLGWCVIMAAVWMLGESKLRQLLLPNASALATMCFVMILLCPVPISYYIDTLQHGRHRKTFNIVENIAFFALLVCSVLHISGIADYIETLPVAHGLLALTVVIVFVTIFEDHKKGYFKGTGYTLVGFERFITSVMSTMKRQEESEGFDFLTGLPMRNRGEKLAAQFMQQDNGYLVFLDMDNLKKINDIYGHKAGDRALKFLGSLLMEHAQHSVVCRLGGDEFLMFVSEVSKEEIIDIVTKIQKKFEQCKEEDMEIRFADISAGICEVNKGDPFEECYSKADKALYYVKQNGKGSYFFYQQMENEESGSAGSGKDLKMIAKALHDSGKYSGVLNLDYRDFARVFEYMNHLSTRHKYKYHLVMVTMETLPDSAPHIESIEEALECMEHVICKKIRSVDVCTRYSSMQYLIILFETEESKIKDIMERIFTQYRKEYKGTSLLPKYEYISMTEEEKKETQV